ncbi:MAG: DUF721 domain-containing protein [Candidatus Cloacimonetes bacterium]|jgi:hypothetical protein|nr:DUF721 domain-containing protein [Candidatus Cloacimonadota bacterium]MBT6993394.1 DUF721 domain-containing protein [Candidatus Cloacimonadota bacterium]MBT7470216.1 DUF721 domain-containing protein [Candidatus Cloacimonadota bacterium]
MAFSKIGQPLHSLIFKIAGPDYEDFLAIALGWKKIVGSLLSERAFVHKIENNVLFVAVSNNVWMQELALNKQLILDKIRTILKIKLVNIVFFITDNVEKYQSKIG